MTKFQIVETNVIKQNKTFGLFLIFIYMNHLFVKGTYVVINTTSAIFRLLFIFVIYYTCKVLEHYKT